MRVAFFIAGHGYVHARMTLRIGARVSFFIAGHACVAMQVGYTRRWG